MCQNLGILGVLKKGAWLLGFSILLLFQSYNVCQLYMFVHPCDVWSQWVFPILALAAELNFVYSCICCSFIMFLIRVMHLLVQFTMMLQTRHDQVPSSQQFFLGFKFSSSHIVLIFLWHRDLQQENGLQPEYLLVDFFTLLTQVHRMRWRQSWGQYTTSYAKMTCQWWEGLLLLT